MKNKRIKLAAAVLCIAFLGISSLYVGGETAKVMPYNISVIYEFDNTVSAVDIVKTSEFSGADDVLLIGVKNEKGETVKAQAIMLDENLPVGVSEITVRDFELGENQKVFVTIWDSLNSLIPMTDGTYPLPTLENERNEGDGEDWIVSENGKRILAYCGEENDIVIPNYIDGKHITAIGPMSTPDNIFSVFGDRAEEITSLKISEGIKQIGPTTFYGCKNIACQADIPESVTYIGNYAFYGCEKITGELVIPDGVEYIYPASFARCGGITSVKLPEGLKGIGSYGFFECSGISEGIEFPEKISRIEAYAFANCASLTGGADLSSVVYVGEYAFVNCGSLNGELNLEKAEYIGGRAFANCKNIVGGLNLREAEYIGDASFANCEKLNGELILSDSLKYIGCVAFQYCNFKGMLNLPEGLVHIGDAAFNHCVGFENESLIIPASVQTLGGDYNAVEENTNYSSHLFYHFCMKNNISAYGVALGNKYFCAKDGVLYDIDMKRLVAYPTGKSGEVFKVPEGIVQLDEMCFGQNKFLKELVLPDSYVIKERAPANVINQDGNTLAVALYNYTGIERISVRETNPNYISVDGALYSKDGKSLWYCPVKIGESYKVLEGTERIETGAVYGVPLQTEIKYFEIPASVKYIAPETVGRINYLFKGNIAVDENNMNYCVESGLLKEVK